MLRSENESIDKQKGKDTQSLREAEQREAEGMEMWGEAVHEMSEQTSEKGHGQYIFTYSSHRANK